MRTLVLRAFAISALLLVACGDETTNVPADTGGGGGGGETDASTTDTGGATDAGGESDAAVCESGVECARIADCASAGLAGAVCQDGCCIEGTGGGGGTDAGGGGEPCGEVTFQGECDGTIVRWCDTESDTLGEVDCADFYGATPGTCAWFGDDFGFWCGVEGSGSCITDDGSIALCASAEDAACVVTGPTPDEVAFTCAEPGLGACDSEAFDGAYCEGNNLVASCTVVQPLVFDCTSFGGTCADGTCVGATEGSICTEDSILCAEGLECVGTEGSPSTCVAGE